MMRYVVYLGIVIALLDSLRKAMADGQITKVEWVGILKDVATAALGIGKKP